MAINTGSFPKALSGGKKKSPPGGLSQMFAKKSGSKGSKKSKC